MNPIKSDDQILFEKQKNQCKHSLLTYSLVVDPIYDACKPLYECDDPIESAVLMPDFSIKIEKTIEDRIYVPRVKFSTTIKFDNRVNVSKVIPFLNGLQTIVDLENKYFGEMISAIISDTEPIHTPYLKPSLNIRDLLALKESFKDNMKRYNFNMNRYDFKFLINPKDFDSLKYSPFSIFEDYYIETNYADSTYNILGHLNKIAIIGYDFVPVGTICVLPDSEFLGVNPTFKELSITETYKDENIIEWDLSEEIGIGILHTHNIAICK